MSVRITDTDQKRLRKLAETRGTSVSEIVRTAAVREASGPRPAAVTSTQSPTSRTHIVGQGLFWQDVPGAQVCGTTITF